MAQFKLPEARQARFATITASALCVAARILSADGAAAATDVHVDDPRVAEIGALERGVLDANVSPQSLFEIPLDDERAVRVEAGRLRTLLNAARASPLDRTGSPASDAGAADAGPSASSPDGDAALWRSRLELDRARLQFLSLPAARREELLRKHAEQQASGRQLADQQHQAQELASERQQSLQAAALARAEGERLVREERARLEALESQLQSVHEQFAERRRDIDSRRDAVLGWERRVHDAQASPEKADAEYDAIRATLSAARDALDRALDELASGKSSVPALGPELLHDIPAGVDTHAVEQRRSALAGEIDGMRADERALRREQAASLLDEVTTLNRQRLDLLPRLSERKGAEVTGFGAAGWDQARAEARHLFLVLRYHLYAAAAFVRSLRAGAPLGVSIWKSLSVLVPLSVLGWAWAAWRRRGPALLALATRQLRDAERAAGRTSPGLARRALRVLVAIEPALEGLVVLGLVLQLLPQATRSLLEVQLLSSVLGWALAGSLVVHGVNALAAGSARGGGPSGGGEALRLRSLRLVGRVVVAFGLTLGISARLVGQGTVYHWVLSTCWLAPLPVLLLLVRWWRETVFERMQRLRRRSRFGAWVLANQTGWKSFLAVALGAVELFLRRALELARTWLGRFTLARRAHAYLFKRELDRLAGTKTARAVQPLREHCFDALSPDAISAVCVASPADRLLELLSARVRAGAGGVVALVGARGLGKSFLLRTLQNSEAGSVFVSAPSLAEPVHALRARLGLGHEPHGGEVAGSPRLILVDDAQQLVRPVIGGLRRFDELLALARGSSSTTLWVFAIDAVLWPLIQRGREVRPLFDQIHLLEPWNDRQIGALLDERSAHAGITPSFEDLLEHPPASEDELDREDALNATRESYILMLWDYVAGNPGLALEAWRSSLVEDEHGVIRARPPHVAPPNELEVLPDSTLFVLRAILQLAPAAARDVAEATRLSHEEVLNAFRFGQAQGYLAEQGGRVEVSWRWLRSITRLLERRHLLVKP